MKICLLTIGAAVATCTAADFSITDHGAKADGSKCTAAFAKAIAACHDAGGGRVVVPAGTWFTGPVHLKSGVDLHLEKGAVLSFSDDPKDCLPAVRSSWEGLECLNYSPLVYAYGCTNVAVTGEGTIRPKMDFWREMMKESKTDIQGARAILYKWGSEDYPVEKRDITKAHPAVMRPQGLQFNRCKNVRLEGVRIEDSPFWTIHLFMSEDVTIRKIDVCAHGFNNDGVDIEMTRNVLIEDSTFDQGDDGFVFKAGRNRDAWRVARPTENVEIRNCRLKQVGSVVGVGSELSGGIRNVYVHDCDVEAAARIFYVKTNHRRGGFVKDVRLENVHVGCTLKVVAVETDVLYQWRVFPEYETRLTEIVGLTVRNVACDRACLGIDLAGDRRLPIRDVTVENVKIGTLDGALRQAKNVENLKVADVTFGTRGKVTTPWGGLADVQPRKPCVAFFGDSISDPHRFGTRLCYWDFLAEQLDIKPLVQAVNGRQWSDIARQAEALAATGDWPDAICILMGTNDYNANVPLGTWYDYTEETVNRDGVPTKLRKRTLSTDAATVRGRINVGLAAIRKRFPTVKVLILTPIHRGYAYLGEKNVQPDESYANKLGLFIDDYVACIAEAGRVHAMQVVDLHADSGIYPLAPEHAEAYFNSDRKDGRTDVLHPNTAAHKLMADAVRPALIDALGRTR